MCILKKDRVNPTLVNGGKTLKIPPKSGDHPISLKSPMPKDILRSYDVAKGHVCILKKEGVNPTLENGGKLEKSPQNQEIIPFP